MDQPLASVHPGDILREEFLTPLEITPYRLEKDIGVPATRIAAILARRRGVTADTALRLGRYFGTSAELWLNLQATFELQEARALGMEAELSRIHPVSAREERVPA